MTNAPRSRRSYLALAGGVVTGVLAGCTEEDNDTHHDDDHSHDDNHDHDDDHDHDHNHEHGHELGHPEEHVEVEMVTDDGHHFIPHVVHVEVGGTVEWMLESGDHNTVAYHPETHGPQQRIPDGTVP